ncbi:MAG: TrkH family potassium uptake protein [Acidobacteriota bacterium]
MKNLKPPQILILSFLFLIISGTILLLLPFSVKDNYKLRLIDALFTAASATCVTGLSSMSISDNLTFFGQLIVLTLIQLGGLGLMTFSSFIALIVGKRFSFKNGIIIQESFLHSPIKNLRKLIFEIIIFTFSIELTGALLLFFYWNNEFPLNKSIYYSIFHSISAFCNAGFSLFNSNLIKYVDSIWINIIIIFLIFSGGIGFFVLRNLKEYIGNFKRRRSFKMPVQVKIVLFSSFFLIIISSFLFMLMEWNKSLSELPIKAKVLSSVFQSVTPRTAGLTTIDISLVSNGAVLLIILLMFIGASPGSTGGGIKTTTFAVLVGYLRARLRNRLSIRFFNRNIPLDHSQKALTIFLIALIVVGISCFLMLISQKNLRFEDVTFEVFSAFGTVGLSRGITSMINSFGKVVLIVTMFIGRVGPITLIYAMGVTEAKVDLQYPEEKIMIG